MEYEIVAYNTAEYQDMVTLRYKILREPLGLNFSDDDLKREKDDIFCVCRDCDQLIACCILTKLDEHKVKLRQMAVAANFQGRGIGQSILAFAEQTAQQAGFGTIILHARNEAVGFYLKCGYKAEGECFTEVGIPHTKMIKEIK